MKVCLNCGYEPVEPIRGLPRAWDCPVCGFKLWFDVGDGKLCYWFFNKPWCKVPDGYLLVGNDKEES